MKYIWIIGGGQLQVPVIEEVHKMGYKTIVSDMNPDCICAKLADIFYPLDIFDIQGHIQLAKNLDIKIIGVIACGIDVPETASWIAKTLGLPAATPEVARICHNKYEFRKALRVLGYPVPDNPEVIVKPINKSGSRDTQILKTSPFRLVETLWHGTEHTVETLFDRYGNFHPCFITDRFFDYSNGYAVETGLRHPTTLPGYLQRHIYNLAERLGRDLGVNASPFKLDIMVTEDGVRVLEATTRLSGGFDCQYLVPLATGKNVIRAAILIALGYTINSIKDWLEPQWNFVGLTASMFLLQGKITKIDDTEARKVEEVKEIFWRYKVGDIVEEYVDSTKRVNFIICIGKTEDETRKTLEEAKSKIILEIE